MAPDLEVEDYVARGLYDSLLRREKKQSWKSGNGKDGAKRGRKMVSAVRMVDGQSKGASDQRMGLRNEVTEEKTN